MAKTIMVVDDSAAMPMSLKNVRAPATGRRQSARDEPGRIIKRVSHGA